MNRASFLSRFLAWLIDLIIIVILSYLFVIIVFLFVGIIGQTTGGLPEPFAFLISQALIIPVFLLQFIYFGYFWQKSGQSIGKGMMGIKVVKSNGDPLSFWISGLRGSFGYWVSNLVFGLGYLWALFDSNQETWHDKLFKTTVLKKNSAKPNN